MGMRRKRLGVFAGAALCALSLALCVAICRALGKTLDDLFWEEDDGA